MISLHLCVLAIVVMMAYIKEVASFSSSMGIRRMVVANKGAAATTVSSVEVSLCPTISS